MKHFLIPLMLVVIAGCVNSEYRFEEIESGQPMSLPLKFDSLYGVRDGYSVNATAQFSDGQDSAEITIALILGPPAQFRSGTYKATIGGRSSQGMVDCESLTFLGGQGSAPSVGGRFVLKDPQGRPSYRVTLPPTPVKRRLSS